MRGANVFLVALALAACLWTIGQAAPAAAQNYGQNQQASGLTPRPTPAASDVVPCQPSGSYTQGCTAAGIAALAGGAPVNTPCNGVADDTGAIIAAIASGKDVQLPAGVCVVSSPLTLTTLANSGQSIRGMGTYTSSGVPGFSTTPPPSATVIRPTSALSGRSLFVVDGTPSSTYLLGVGFENLAIDMVNMSDVSGSAAFEMDATWDDHFHDVRVLNDGMNKRAWLYKTGSYLTTMLNTVGNIVDFEGTGPGNGTTTVNLMNHDGNEVIISWANGIRIYGGALQSTTSGGSPPHVVISNSEDVDINTDVEGAGTYIAFQNFTAGVRSRSELGGSTGAYYTGSPGLDTVFEDDLPSYQGYGATFRSWAGDHINAHGAAGYGQWLSGAVGYDYSLQVGRAATDGGMAVVGTAGHWANGSAVGDVVLYGAGVSNCVWLAPNYEAALEACPGFLAFSKPIRSAIFQPATDGQYLTLENAAGTGFEVVVTSATLASTVHSFGQGMKLLGYSDAFGTQTWKIDGSNGTIQSLVNNSIAYQVGGAAGANCNAGTVNLSTLTIAAGIVTHC